MNFFAILFSLKQSDYFSNLSSPLPGRSGAVCTSLFLCDSTIVRSLKYIYYISESMVPITV